MRYLFPILLCLAACAAVPAAPARPLYLRAWQASFDCAATWETFDFDTVNVPKESKATHLRPIWVEARQRGPMEQSGVMVGMPVRLLTADSTEVNGKDCPGDAIDPNVQAALKARAPPEPEKKAVPLPAPGTLPSWFRP